MVKEPPLYSDIPLNNPEAVVQVLSDTLSDYDREVFAVVNLRSDLCPINVNVVSIGALEYSLTHPREILKSMVLSNTSRVMLVHNHPSGNLNPSKEDIAMTDRMAKVCEILAIPLVDHVIVGGDKQYYSFHEKGLITLPKVRYAQNLDEINLGGVKVAEVTMEKSTKLITSYTVAECSEFHSQRELHENIKSIGEAIEIYKKIPPERMNAIPAIGIRVTDADNPEVFTEVDVLNGNTIDLEVLKYLPGIEENKVAQFAVAELLYHFKDAEVRGEVTEELQKKVQAVDIREKQEAQLKDIMDKLEKGVIEVVSSEKYQQFLDMVAKFPRYSTNNCILIMLQKPDAQMCQSFTNWKELGRYVKQGEKGIKIIAPSSYTVQREQQKKDVSGKPIFDLDGEPIMEIVEVKVNAFKVVNTFDVSQTDGKELPTIEAKELQGDVDKFAMLFEALKQACPVPIEFEQIESGAKGYYSQSANRIAINEGMSEVQTVKTTIHEMAHQKLHALTSNNVEQSKSSKEVEAESVAYTVCQHYGIDTSDYSFNYVAGWSEGKELPELKASLDTIRRAASEMITSIDEKLEELSKREKTQEQTIEQTENSSGDETDRKEELQELVKSTAVQLSAEAKGKQEEKPIESEKPEKKRSVKKQISEKKETTEQAAKPKKTKTRSVREAI